LDIKTEEEGWNLIIENKLYPLNNIKLSPGTYNAKLTNECYEDIINLNAEIKKDENSVFDVSSKAVIPKTANLALYVKYKGRNQKEPVFIDGMEVGNTPFKGLVPACSKKVEFGKDKLQVNNLDGLKRGGMEYTHNLPTLKSTLLSLAIGLVSGALLYHAYDLSTEVDYYMDRYNGLSSGKISEYDNYRKSAKDTKDKIPLYLISGGVLAVSAVGVYIWF